MHKNFTRFFRKEIPYVKLFHRKILENKHNNFRSEHLKGTGHLEDLEIDGRIILKWFLSKQFEDVE